MEEIEIKPKTNQIFYVLLNDENDILHSVDTSHTFTTPLITKAMFFDNKELAERYNTKHRLKFKVVKVSPKYTIA